MKTDAPASQDKTALIVGVTGIVGHNLAEHLVSRNWKTIGLARRPGTGIPGVETRGADLLDLEGLRAALKDTRPTHVFFATWSRQETEAENIRVNGAMMHHLLDVLRPQQSIEHFALVTGLKHYLGPFEKYGKLSTPPTPFLETQPRLDFPNFYYTLEDEVFAAAAQDGFGWTVHRPHTIIGFAPTNVMNMGMTLGAYAAFCRETGHPFAFPGNETQWNSLVDVTDARQIAAHLEWAATTPGARNHPLNVTNGDIFRWKWMWGRIADWFGLAPVPFAGEVRPLSKQMADAKPQWEEIARQHRLAEPDLERIASFWHADADLQRPFECVTDMTSSRLLGFTLYRSSEQSFFDTFARMRAERIIP